MFSAAKQALSKLTTDLGQEKGAEIEGPTQVLADRRVVVKSRTDVLELSSFLSPDLTASTLASAEGHAAHFTASLALYPWPSPPPMATKHLFHSWDRGRW